MQSVFANLPLVMLIGIGAVLIISQLRRLLGSILGVIFWGAMAVLGSFAYSAGFRIGLPGLPFSRPVFLLVCLGFALIHGFGGVMWLRGQRRRELTEQARRIDEG